jgi:O-antigen ligase
LLGPASDFFLMYDRAKAAFNDPNVLGAFLVLPALLMLQRVLTGGIGSATRGAVLLGLMVVALLLSFSRAAWGQFAFCAGLLMFLTFVTTRASHARLRILLIAIAGVAAMVLLLAALLSVDRVAELFQQRASLEQSYDVGHLGRFGRYSLGAELALDRPFGIGPLQFHFLFPEDVHNTYLNALLSGGWLSGVTYWTLTLTTLWLGFRTVFVDTPWRHTYLVVYCAYVGTAAESAIIDSDHWRHYFLLVGVIWGLMTVSRAYIGANASRARHAGTAALAPNGRAA